MSLIEDHQGTREALKLSLGSKPQQLTLVGAYDSAEAFLRVSAERMGDVALIDLHLPGLAGASLIEELGRHAPMLKCLALTALEQEADVLEAIRAGACGYMLKDEPTSRIVASIEEAVAGAYPISSRVAGFLFRQASRAPVPAELSTREEELATCLAQGLSYAEAAQEMGVAIGTVQMYVKRLYKKLGVDSKRGVREWFATYGEKGSVAVKRRPID